MNYLNMADLFLNFVRATRIGDWLFTFSLVTWYFANDHLNYVRYLPVYIYEMLAIPDIHLSIVEHLTAGIL